MLRIILVTQLFEKWSKREAFHSVDSFFSFFANLNFTPWIRNWKSAQIKIESTIIMLHHLIMITRWSIFCFWWNKELVLVILSLISFQNCIVHTLLTETRVCVPFEVKDGLQSWIFCKCEFTNQLITFMELLSK